jgi:hypothetical protein
MRRFDAKRASYTAYSSSGKNGVVVYEVLMALEECQEFMDRHEPRAILNVDGKDVIGLFNNRPGVPHGDGRFRLTFTDVT